jgi:hypothetical protein
MNVGIVGLPQAGVTTVFNALTGAHGEVGGYHPGEHVSLGVVRVPDARLDPLAETLQPDEVIQATIQFEDIGGVFAHLTGGDQSGRAVGALRDTDAILMVLRCFESPFVLEVFGEVDPMHEYRAMTEEMLLADLQVIEKRLDAIETDLRKATPERERLEKERELLERCRTAIEEERSLRDIELNRAHRKMLRNYSFLTLKPRLCLLNIGEGQIGDEPELEKIEPPPIPICAELEMEIMELDDEEDREVFLQEAGLEQPAAGRVIRACYDLLDLRTFFTHVHGQLRAWTVEAGATAPEAAGKVHSDMQEGFIRAEVVSTEDLLACGSGKDARSAGKLRMEGKDYEVQDGDVITFHFSR